MTSNIHKFISRLTLKKYRLSGLLKFQNSLDALRKKQNRLSGFAHKEQVLKRFWVRDAPYRGKV